jgi:hypothetical protein
MEANITNAKIEDAACIYLKWRPIALTHRRGLKSALLESWKEQDLRCRALYKYERSKQRDFRCRVLYKYERGILSNSWSEMKLQVFLTETKMRVLSTWKRMGWCDRGCKCSLYVKERMESPCCLVQYFSKIENIAHAFCVPSVAENTYLLHCVNTNLWTL